MNFIEFQVDKLQQAGASLLSPASIFSAPQLAVAFTLAFAYLAWRQFRRRKAVRLSALLRATMSRRILFHRSTAADLFYFFVNTFAIGGLIGWGLFSSLAISEGCVHVLRTAFGDRTPSSVPEWALRVGITLTVFLGYEFGYYVDHYLKHKIPFLWAFHKTHHTAEVLTPLTVFRVHPVDTLIFVDIIAVAIGISQGLFTYAAGKTVSTYAIENTNIITIVFLFLLAQLQHSEFWIPLTGVAGRILLSPAHHQIHHSSDPAHYDSNLGSFLAIWDWLFGTLSIPPKQSPHLKFGVTQANSDPHRISALLIEPGAEALAALGFATNISRGETRAPSSVAIDTQPQS
jgi:sterol desaturase/sphingolipid hydroxylase (fatty acid hydroxylase superfamily)